MKSFQIFTLTSKQLSFQMQTFPVIRKRILLAKHAPQNTPQRLGSAREAGIFLVQNKINKTSFSFKQFELTLVFIFQSNFELCTIELKEEIICFGLFQEPCGKLALETVHNFILRLLLDVVGVLHICLVLVYLKILLYVRILYKQDRRNRSCSFAESEAKHISRTNE